MIVRMMKPLAHLMPYQIFPPVMKPVVNFGSKVFGCFKKFDATKSEALEREREDGDKKATRSQIRHLNHIIRELSDDLVEKNRENIKRVCEEIYEDKDAKEVRRS